MFPVTKAIRIRSAQSVKLSDRSRVSLNVPTDSYSTYDYIPGCNSHQLSSTQFVAHKVNQVHPTNMIYVYNKSRSSGLLCAHSASDARKHKTVVFSQEAIRLSDIVTLVGNAFDYTPDPHCPSDVQFTWKITGPDRVSLNLDLSHVTSPSGEFSIRFDEFCVLYRSPIGKVPIIPLLSMTHVYAAESNSNGFGHIEFQFPFVQLSHKPDYHTKSIESTSSHASIRSSLHPYTRQRIVSDNYEY